MRYVSAHDRAAVAALDPEEPRKTSEAVGIMGVGKIVPRPMYNEAGEIYRAEMAYLSFTFDHRVLDGAA